REERRPVLLAGLHEGDDLALVFDRVLPAIDRAVIRELGARDQALVDEDADDLRRGFLVGKRAPHHQDLGHHPPPSERAASVAQDAAVARRGGRAAGRAVASRVMRTLRVAALFVLLALTAAATNAPLHFG